MFLPEIKSNGSNLSICPDFGCDANTHSPPNFRTELNASMIPSVEPVASIAKSHRSPLLKLSIWDLTFSVAELIVFTLPKLVANLSFASSLSTTITNLGFLLNSAKRALIPIAPKPKTMTLLSVRLFGSSLSAKPAPVGIAQPKRDAITKSVFFETLKTQFSDTITTVPKVAICPELMISFLNLYFGPGTLSPSPRIQLRITFSPCLTFETPEPVSRTIPDASCPNKWGKYLSGPLKPSTSMIWLLQIPA